MSFWVYSNIAGSVIVALLLATELLRFGRGLNSLERFGLGLIGAALILNIGPTTSRWLVWNEVIETPFDGWASLMLRIGIALYTSGRLVRLFAHARNNRLQVKSARQSLAEARAARP